MAALPDRAPLPSRSLPARAALVLLGLALLLSGAAACRDDPAPSEPDPRAYVPGELVVILAPGVEDSTLARELTEQGLALLGKVADEPPIRLIRVPEGEEDYWADELVRQGLVIAADRNPG